MIPVYTSIFVSIVRNFQDNKKIYKGIFGLNSTCQNMVRVAQMGYFRRFFQ